MFRSSAVKLAKTPGVRSMSNVGFIGLGNMGGYMARHLLKKGHRLSVYDVSESTVNQLKAENKNVAICNNPLHVAEHSDMVVTMLPNNQIVLDTYLGKNGILKGSAKKPTLIDSSTIAPSVAKEIHSAAKEQGVDFIDAPVSGGVLGARDATLTFMAGGPKKTVDHVEQILLGMGKRVVHCGDIGSGQVAKICNNMLLAISMIGTAECMNLGIKLGLDAKVLMDIVNTSTGRCWSSEMYNPVPNLLANVPPSDGYKGGFSTRLIVKDLGLAENAAKEAATPILLGSLAHQIYRTMDSNGYAHKDFASVYEFINGKE